MAGRPPPLGTGLWILAIGLAAASRSPADVQRLVLAAAATTTVCGALREHAARNAEDLDYRLRCLLWLLKGEQAPETTP